MNRHDLGRPDRGTDDRPERTHVAIAAGIKVSVWLVNPDKAYFCPVIAGLGDALDVLTARDRGLLHTP